MIPTNEEIAAAREAMSCCGNESDEKFIEWLEAQQEVIADAWEIIANAHGGNWNKGTREWKKAAERWRGMVFGDL